jgi:predicted NBD/HSP70 family sugar kinase
MDHRSSSDSRTAEIQRLTTAMDRAKTPSDGQFNALGMLITDASLTGDAAALTAAQDGLQWLFRRYADEPVQGTDERGRILGLIDVTHWALRRLPASLQLSLDPDGHSARFLLAVARHPGLSNQDIARHLRIDDTEASRVGRRLLGAGLVWRRKQWRRNVWDITPRGMQYVETSGLRDRLHRDPHASVRVGGHPLAYAVGVKMLPGRLLGVVTDAGANVITERTRDLHGPVPVDTACTELASLVRELIQAVPRITDKDPVGLGIEIGGHVASAEGEVVCAPNYAPHGDWAEFPFANRIGDELGLPTVIENDANALAEWEHGFGPSRDLGCTATLLLDQGIGCGIVVNGDLVHGFGGSAGELGHVVIDPAEGGKCRCGNIGCLETVAGTGAIVEAVVDRTKKLVPDLAAVAALAETGEEPVVEALRHAGTALGRGLSALLNLMNPKQVTIYGPPQVMNTDKYAAARYFMGAVREASTRYAFSTAGRDCTIVCKTYTESLGARAAAAVALLRNAAKPG